MIDFISKNILGIVTVIMLSLVVWFVAFTNKPLIKDYEVYQADVTVNFEDRDTIQRRFKEINGYESNVEGFAVLYPEDRECVIYTLPIRHQKDTYRIELLGHEYLHCVYGRWHDE